MAYIPDSGSVLAFQGTVPWSVMGGSTNSSVITTIQGSVGAVIIGGSIAASFTPPANQSVSGTVGASIIGLTPVSVSNFPATQNISGSVAAWLQSTNASVITVGSPVANQSVSGTVQAQLQSTNASVISVPQGSIAAVIIGGSIAASFTPPANQSVSGTVDVSQTGAWRVSVLSSVPSSLLAGVSIIGQLPTGTAMLGSIVAYQGVPSWNVSGSVAAFQAGTQITSLVSTVPSSVLVGASIFGQLPAGTAMLGSVVAYQGVVPWVANFQNSSIVAVLNNQSIVGTYAEDVAFTQGDKGFLQMAVRNDLNASISGANLDYTPMTTDSAGRTLFKPFSAEESRIEGYHSVVSGSVTTLIAAGGAGIRNYITDVWFANTGATTTLVTLRDGLGSILGYTIAPSGGGTNLNGLLTPIRTSANASFDFSASPSTSILYGTAKGFKAP